MCKYSHWLSPRETTDRNKTNETDIITTVTMSTRHTVGYLWYLLLVSHPPCPVLVHHCCLAHCSWEERITCFTSTGRFRSYCIIITLMYRTKAVPTKYLQSVNPPSPCVCTNERYANKFMRISSAYNNSNGHWQNDLTSCAYWWSELQSIL